MKYLILPFSSSFFAMLIVAIIEQSIVNAIIESFASFEVVALIITTPLSNAIRNLNASCFIY